MNGPYQPGAIVAASVSASENISSVAKSAFHRLSGGTISDITSAVTLTVSGTGTQECTVKWTISSGYSPGDMVWGTVIVTLATSGAQAPMPLHEPITLVQWPATAMPAAAARSSLGLAAVADVQANSMLGPAQTVSNPDGTTTVIPFNAQLVGATVGKLLLCIDTGETSRILSQIQNIGTGVWNVTVASAFAGFANPNGKTFAALGLTVPAVDAMTGKVAATVAAGDNSDKSGYSLSAAGVQAIWDALTSAMVTANSIGKRLLDFVTSLVYSAPPTKEQIATQVELQIMDEGDGEQVLAAIVNKINSVDTDLSGLSIAAIAAASATSVWANAGRTLTAGVDVATWGGSALPTIGTSTLTGADVQAALTAQGFTSTRGGKLDNLDVAVSSRLAASSYVAPLDAIGVRGAIGMASDNLDALLASLLTSAAFAGSDAAIAGTQVLTMLEPDSVAGGSVKRLTAHALANAPAGGAGGSGGPTIIEIETGQGVTIQ